MRVDYLIVGSGLTGATIARDLVDAGREVLVVERRSHLGGNVHDSLDEHGIRIHTYGPHYFRTSSKAIWNFVTRFAAFYSFKAIVKTYVDGEFYDWPLTKQCFSSVSGDTWNPEDVGTASNFEEACLKLMPRPLYEKFVHGYTEKQWGVRASTLCAALARRLEVRSGESPYLTTHRFQGLPTNGYAEWVEHILQGITVFRNWDYLERRGEIESRKCLVFTGPIDEYFGFEFGRLKYRGQQRVHTYVDCDGYSQPAVQVNNPDPQNGQHIRTIEWKHMMPADRAFRIRGTVLTREYPITPRHASSFEYPFPDQRNAQLYSRYSALANSIPGLLVCGRLGEYRYYDMDQAIARARILAARLLVCDAQRYRFGDHQASMSTIRAGHKRDTGAA